MKDSIFPGEKWCFFMCAIAEGKTIENLVAATSNPEAFDAILRWSPAGARILLLVLPYALARYTRDMLKPWVLANY